MDKAKRKVDPKTIFKSEIMADVAKALALGGFEVDTDSESFAFTKNTIVVKGKDYDLQLKPITPKTGLTRYAKVEECEDEE